MTKRGTASTSPAEKPTVYRGVAAILGGAVAALFCLYGAIDLAVEVGSPDLIGIAVLVLVAVLAAVFGIYPAAFSDDEGLRIRNPFRSILLPWSVVTDLSARLSFVAHTESTRFTVFAIPVSLRERRRADRQRLKAVAQAQREARRGIGGGAQNSLPFGAPRTRQRHHDEHIERLAFADQAIVEMNARRDAQAARAKVAAAKAAAAAAANGAGTATTVPTDEGTATTPTAAAVSVTEPSAALSVAWTWSTIGLLGAAVVFVIVAIIVK
jgi:Bacterial PH domain